MSELSLSSAILNQFILSKIDKLYTKSNETSLCKVRYRTSVTKEESETGQTIRGKVKGYTGNHWVVVRRWAGSIYSGMRECGSSETSLPMTLGAFRLPSPRLNR